MLSPQAKEVLLSIARRSVEEAVTGSRRPSPQVDLPELQEHQGAFVTLRTHGDLRGCIGRFVADRPLWQIVRDMAVESATADPRFFGRRLRPDELADLTVEISVLSPLRRIRDVENEFELGKHGVYITDGLRSGCFLPQVALETGWSKEEFLSYCCAGKAGLAADAWRDPSVQVSVFTAEILEEG